MGEMDDPLQKVAEQLYDQLGRDLTKQFPKRRADIDVLLMEAGPKHKDGGKRVRGVKGSRGRPPINKSVLVGWLLLLVKIIKFAELYAQVDKGKPLTPELLPSGNWAFKRIAKIGLAYSIAEGSNPIKYPLTSASTLKRHYTFSSTGAVDPGDAVEAYWNLSRMLSFYLGQPPKTEAYYFKQLGDVEDKFLRGWKYFHSRYEAEAPEPWRDDFEVAAKDTESGPPMILHFSPMGKSTWQYFKDGLGIWGTVEIEQLKNNPPSKERIAAHRDFRRNNPVPDY